MSWDELFIWTLIVGGAICLVWLVASAVEGLGAWWRALARHQVPPAPPRVVLGPARQVRMTPPPAPQAEPRGEAPPAPPRVVLGPVRRMQVNTPALPSGMRVRRGAPLVIPRRHDPLWMEKGWRRNGRGYTGYYCAGGRRWRGLIEEPYPGGYKAFIWDPPLRELGGHPHRPCFRRNGRDGRYEVHFHSMPASLDHAITNVETVLAEALARRAWR